ncbi:MAG: hypothetical protein RIT43_2483 [Bacteroidota bacterium]
MKIVPVLLFLMIAPHQLLGQKTFVVHDENDVPIPFVKVIPDYGDAQLADIDGVFTVSDKTSQVLLKSSGFLDTTLLLMQLKGTVVKMSPAVAEIMEIKVIAGENPAHRIIDRAIENRKKNNPTENDAFRYNSYSKFIFTADPETVAAISDTTKDTTLIKIREFFDKQHLFMLESASTRTFMPPSRDKEEITAYKVSGFTDPAFSTFANEVQSFSFYENQFQLLGKSYINPIALGGTKRYLFILEDTTIVNSDTTFTIFYRPRKGRNFEGMTGRLYINTNGFAVEKVTASPYEDTTGIKLQIVQEYRFTNGKKWFPEKLSTEIRFPGNVSVEGLEIIGKGNTYIKDVDFDPEGVRRRDFNNVTVTTRDDAGEQSDREWDSLRVFRITEKEKNTYTFIDSVSKANHLDRRLKALTALAEGKLPFGYVNLDLTRLLDFDQYQEARFGAGLETSRKAMKFATVGGYYAWSTRDKESKYGGYARIWMAKELGVKLDLRFQQDVFERGGYSFQKDGFSLNSTSLYRHLFIRNMDRQRLAEAVFSFNIRSNMKFSLIGNFQRISFTEGYRYYPSGNLLPNTFISECDLAETGLEISWNIAEKVMQLGEQRISKGTKWPRIVVKVTKGLKGVYSSQFEYTRINAEIQQDIALRGLGKLTLMFSGGVTDGEVPLFLLQTPHATGLKWNLATGNTFETMPPSMFYNQRQVASFVRMNFYAFKTRAKWNEPQIGLHHAIGIGSGNNSLNHSFSIASMDKGYAEAGLYINGLFVNGFSAFGIGGFYNYGAYANPDWKKNIVPKLSLTMNL